MECDRRIHLAEHLEQAINNFAAQLCSKLADYQRTAELLQHLHLFPRNPEFSRRQWQLTPELDRFNEALSETYSEPQPLPTPPPLQHTQRQAAAGHSESEAAVSTSIGAPLPEPLYFLYAVISFSIFVEQIYDRLRRPPQQRPLARRERKLRLRKRIRHHAKNTKRVPLREFLGSFKPHGNYHDESSSDSVGDLRDLQRYPPLLREATESTACHRPTALRRTRPRQRHDTSQRRQLGSEATPQTAALPTMHSTATCQNAALVYAEAYHGLNQGVRIQRMRDPIGRMRHDWLCSCGYQNFQDRTECRCCGLSKGRPPPLSSPPSPSNQKGCLLQ